VNHSGLAAVEPRYAGFLRRLGALAIDALVAYVVLSIAIYVIVPGWAGDDATSHQTAEAGVIVLAVITFWFNYLVLAEWRWGQTLGKLALRITVADDRGGVVSWNRSVARNLLLVVDVVAGPVLIPLSRRKQRLGDRLAGTVVLVKDEAASAAGALPASAAGSLPPPSTAAPPPPPRGPEPSPGKPSATWGPGRVAGGIGVLLVTTVVEVGVVSVFDPNLDSLAARLVTQALLAVTLVGIAFLVSAGGRRGVTSPPALGLRRPLRSPIGLAAAAYLGYIVMALAYSTVIHPHQEDVTRDLGFGHGAFGAVAAGVLIVIAAPISEEIFFRGFIFGGLRHRLSFPAAGLISAVIFGLFHYTGPGSLGVVPQLAFLGFALSWVYEETGSIYPTMAIHAVNNALAFALLTS
jgi:membrane protease YdiL (CAAX protease family)